MEIPVLKTLEEYNKFYLDYLISKGFFKDPNVNIILIKNISDNKKIETMEIKKTETKYHQGVVETKYKISVTKIIPEELNDNIDNTCEEEKFEVSSFEKIPQLLEQAINQIKEWDDPEKTEHIIQPQDTYEYMKSEWAINPSAKNQKLHDDIRDYINKIAKILKYFDTKKIERTRIVNNGICYFFKLDRIQSNNIILPTYIIDTPKRIEWHKKIIKLIVFEIKALRIAGFKPEYVGLDANYNIEKDAYTIGILPEWRLKYLIQKNNKSLNFSNMTYYLPIGKDKDLLNYWSTLYHTIEERIKKGEDIYKDIFNVKDEKKEHIIQQQDTFEYIPGDWAINPIMTFSVPKFLDNPKQKCVIITVPHKGEKFARKIAKNIESKYNVKTFINYKTSRKVFDFNRLKSRNTEWRKNLTNTLIYADIVLDLHDSVLDNNNIYIFNSSLDWNKQNIEKFAKNMGATILSQDNKNDILNECESYGIPCVVFEFNRFELDDKICLIADKIIKTIEENTFNNIKILNGRFCPKCRTFYNENKRKCDICNGKLKNRAVKQKCN